MDFSLEQQLSLLKGFSVCFFKDKRFSKESPSHRYITIPTKDDFCLILCIVTSQIDSQSEYYSKTNKKCLDSLIIVEQHEMPDCLTKKSVVDCNKAQYLHKTELAKIIEPGSYHFKREDIPEDIKAKVLMGINNSPMIPKYIRDAIKTE